MRTNHSLILTYNSVEIVNSRYMLEYIHSLDEEFSNDLHVPIMLLEKRGVARSFKCNPFNLLNVVEKWLYDEILSNVLAPINDESWSADKMKTINDRPIFQNAV